MKTAKLLSSAACLAVLLAPSLSSAAIVKYKVKLDASQVTPPTDSPATGSAILEFDDATSELEGQIDLTLTDGTKVTGQYIHVGKCGSSGPSKVSLTEPGLNGVIVIDPPKKLDQTLATALASGELYINVRTEKYPMGEIRGQILPEDGAQTCPATTRSSADPTQPSSDMAPDGGNAPPSGDDQGGCNASGGASGSFATMGLAGVALVVLAARRKRR